MNELISRVMASAGIDEPLARKAVGIILNFLNREGPDEPMQTILAVVPESDELMAEGGGGGGGGIMGNLMGGMGAMGALNELTSAGLSMGEVQSVTSELVAFAKEKAGPEPVDDVVQSIPGLSQFV